MMHQLLRKLRGDRCTRPFTRHRKFTHERLEPRMMMTINPIGDEFLVNDTIPGFQGINENVSSVAVSDTAGTIAAYSGLGAGRRESIFVRRYDSAGVEQGAAVRANTTIRGERTGAVVAANDLGSSVVVWQGRGPADKYGIFMQRFDDSGTAVGGEQLVNETVGGKQHDPAVAMAADGSFVVSWSGPTTADTVGVYARRFAADGTALAGEELVNTTTVDHQIESAIASNSSGDYIITWSSRNQDGDDWGVFGQRFNAAGVRQGGEFAVNTTTAGSQRESSVAMQDDGTFLAVWSSFGQDGDSWAIVAQRFDATGAAAGSEFVVNSSTTGHQRYAQVAGGGGSYLVTWQSGVADGSGWEVMAQELDATGTRIGSEMSINLLRSGANSGHQENPTVALNAAGNGAILWSGYGSTDRQGVFGRSFRDDGAASEDNLPPDLATIADQTVVPSTEMTLTVTATDPNAGDTLTYQLDPTASPATATIEKTDNNTAIIRWTPTAGESDSVVRFRVLVTDNGVPALADAEEFDVTVTDGRITLDLNGSDEPGSNTTAPYAVGFGPSRILQDDLLIVGVTDDTIARASVQLTDLSSRSEESLEVDPTVLATTNIEASYSTGLRRLLLAGEDTTENYERVLRTLRYNNTATNPSGTRVANVLINDASFRVSNSASVTINIGTADLVGFAQALTDSGTSFFGAAWCPECTEQKERFEDGGQFLPFIEVTNPDRTPNAIAAANMITRFPTWVFPDGSRLEGVQSLETLAQRSGVPIPVSDDPFVAPIADSTLLIGAPLHVPLDGYDPNGGPLTYTVSTNRPGAIEEARILSGNRSALINVAGYGDMVFELFEQRADRATDRFIDLVESDFYDDIIFHRVINDFVIQAGLETSTGVRDSMLADFDDLFNFDLQHIQTGLLSYAKSNEDTNGSQFFVTEGPSRHLDFHHSIFGILVEGEANRDAISNTAVSASVPTFDVTIENAEIFQDNENAVLLLKANAGVTGDVVVTVTATDQQGNSFDRQFTVTVAEDTSNGLPFFVNEEIVAPTSVVAGSTAQILLQAATRDIEGDPVFYNAEIPTGNTVPYTFTASDDGIVDITLTDPTATGTLQINVMTAADENAFVINPFELPNPRGARDGRVDLQLITIEVV